MKVILNKKEFELKSITINKYEEIQNSEEEISNSKLISILTDIKESDIRNATIDQINFVSKVIKNYTEQETQKSELTFLINYNGEKLGLVTPSNMLYGEFIDLEVLMSSQPLDLRHIAAILYRPVVSANDETGEREIVEYDYDECLLRSKSMGHFEIKYILSALFFFTKLGEIFMEGIQNYLAKQRTSRMEKFRNEMNLLLRKN